MNVSVVKLQYVIGVCLPEGHVIHQHQRCCLTDTAPIFPYAFMCLTITWKPWPVCKEFQLARQQRTPTAGTVFWTE